MVACIRHGTAFEKKPAPINGNPFVELIPVTVSVDNGYYDAAYSTVARTVEYAHSMGVSPDLWPIYYGFGDSEIDLAEVDDRCHRLSQHLLALPADAVSSNILLKQVVDWLSAGERFFITE